MERWKSKLGNIGTLDKVRQGWEKHKGGFEQREKLGRTQTFDWGDDWSDEKEGDETSQNEAEDLKRANGGRAHDKRNHDTPKKTAWRNMMRLNFSAQNIFPERRRKL